MNGTYEKLDDDIDEYLGGDQIELLSFLIAASKKPKDASVSKLDHYIERNGEEIMSSIRPTMENFEYIRVESGESVLPAMSQEFQWMYECYAAISTGNYIKFLEFYNPSDESENIIEKFFLHAWGLMTSNEFFFKVPEKSKRVRDFNKKLRKMKKFFQLIATKSPQAIWVAHTEYYRTRGGPALSKYITEVDFKRPVFLDDLPPQAFTYEIPLVIDDIIISKSRLNFFDNAVAETVNTVVAIWLKGDPLVGRPIVKPGSVTPFDKQTSKNILSRTIWELEQGSPFFNKVAKGMIERFEDDVVQTGKQLELVETVLSHGFRETFECFWFKKKVIPDNALLLLQNNGNIEGVVGEIVRELLLEGVPKTTGRSPKSPWKQEDYDQMDEVLRSSPDHWSRFSEAK
jgi:hypothetical protein